MSRSTGTPLPVASHDFQSPLKTILHRSATRDPSLFFIKHGEPFEHANIKLKKVVKIKSYNSQNDAKLTVKPLTNCTINHLFLMYRAFSK